MNLHKDGKIFEDVITHTAEFFKTSELYIEKDYWITKCLMALAQSPYGDKIVFKGGTSLSKCYGLIERFSEDIDIAVLCKVGMSNNQIKKLIKAVDYAGSAGLEMVENDHRTSRGSRIRKTVLRYPNTSENTNADFGPASQEILLEVNSFTDPEPYEKMTVQTYISKFLAARKPELIEVYGLTKFSMNVLSLKRTAAEKIMGLIRAGYGENGIDELGHKIRHLYDLYHILTDAGTADFVKSDAFFYILDAVIACDKISLPEAPWCEEPLGSALLFSRFETIWPQLKKTYFNDFSKLVFDKKLPNKDELTEMIHTVQERLSIYDMRT